MIDEQIRDGDYVIIERRNTARNGQTVVALLDTGEATLKKFYREAGPHSAPARQRSLRAHPRQGLQDPGRGGRRGAVIQQLIHFSSTAQTLAKHSK